MTVDVLVQREPGGEYRATVLGWPECTASAPSRQEVLQRARQSLVDLLHQAEIVRLDVKAQRTSSSLAQFAGMWARDETLDKFVTAMETYRHVVDADECQL